MDAIKLNAILKSMEEQNVPQMIISDPPSIFYLTGKWIHPGERMLALYLNVNGNHKLVINKLFPQERDLGVELVWYDDIEDAVAILAQFVEKDKTIGIDKTWPARFLLRLQELGAGSKFVNGSLIVDYVRQIKNEEEQQRMREAGAANDKIMERLIPYVNKGLTEKELEKIVRQMYAETGHSGVSFDPITAYGKSGADPHHVTDETKGKRGDSVVLDIGGILNDYCSDMTRTVFLGEVSEKGREIYEIVKEAERRGIEAAKPGNRMCDVDNACRDYITEMGYGPYFTHRTGHSIGMEDHEFGDVSSVNTDIIKPGQCFSVEPGIYLMDEGIGVRIEDIVLITEDGCEVLNNFTKDLIVVPMED
jgi:Xaa-Pro dipeptidase